MIWNADGNRGVNDGYNGLRVEMETGKKVVIAPIWGTMIIYYTWQARNWKICWSTTVNYNFCNCADTNRLE